MKNDDSASAIPVIHIGLSLFSSLGSLEDKSLFIIWFNLIFIGLNLNSFKSLKCKIFV
jgi:hypothetical protein